MLSSAPTPLTPRAVLAKARYVPPVLVARGVSASPHTAFASSGVSGGVVPSSLTVELCKNGGWQDLGFRTQGQCIQFVNTGK